ncbi:MAG TPA: glycosyltransferase [Anaeromyxobacteraceae bacterium]|nr:glycosyltransferase [Anaeromyxobacteraceae bacterium]
MNQLITLAREARHDLLVVSDSNVRVAPGYLAGIAAHLERPEAGLVTHLAAGVSERRPGSLFENLHLAGSIAPGVAAARHLAGRDLVIGKSMALRRRDLAVPIKDLCFAWAWARGFLEDEVVWRGNRLRVLKGSALRPARRPAPVAPAGAGLALRPARGEGSR